MDHSPFCIRIDELCILYTLPDFEARYVKGRDLKGGRDLRQGLEKQGFESKVIENIKLVLHFICTQIV